MNALLETICSENYIMSIIKSLLFALVSFIASAIGAICGIGGGVIIKPTLDLFGWEDVSTISFLSGCTVLSMSCYSVGKSMLSGEKTVNLKLGTPIAIGAAIGGICGKQIFSTIKAISANPEVIGGIQAICLAAITFGTLIYTLKRCSIQAKAVCSPLLCALIGLVLGIISSFLGIGGGPINLAVLYYFFGMDTKTATANSLYIIFFSQIASLFTTIITRSVPEFVPVSLTLMVVSGIVGGIIGRRINKRIIAEDVEKLFISLMIVIIGVSLWNVYGYFSIL